MIDISKAIRENRENLGWSIYRLSQESGVQKTNIARIEDGRYSARYDTIEKLLDAMDLKIVIDKKL